MSIDTGSPSRPDTTEATMPPLKWRRPETAPKLIAYYAAGRAAHAGGTLYSDCPGGYGGDAREMRDAEQEARQHPTKRDPSKPIDH